MEFEEWSTIGDGGPAAVSSGLTVGGKHFHIFESSQLEDSYAEVPLPKLDKCWSLTYYSLLISLSYLQASSKDMLDEHLGYFK